ncbi:MAG: SpoIID/LytB domain-containing protein [Thermodesulfovibrionales bacterium]|nr:SpoIID/LytB domain-containing protein [Thermodesulfovibrionales bacterium]
MNFKKILLKGRRKATLLPALLSILIFHFSCATVQSNDALTVRVLMLDSGEKPGKELQYTGRLEGSLLINGEAFNGSVEVWKGNGGLYFINIIPLEEYVKGVVAAESGRDWPLEAYKVQAVIARTYALYHMKKNREMAYHVTSGVLHQVFKNGPYDERVVKAVEETEGEILIFNGEPIEAFYHSTSTGFTEAPEEVFSRNYPYIRPVKVTARLSPYETWQRSISIKDIERVTELYGIKDIFILSRTSTGRARELGIRTDSGLKILKATELRRLLGWQTLPSTGFELRREGDFIIFSGRGYGHGVGLSQWSSLDMVLEGKSYREVLQYFYPGTEIIKIKGNL